MDLKWLNIILLLLAAFFGCSLLITNQIHKNFIKRLIKAFNLSQIDDGNFEGIIENYVYGAFILRSVNGLSTNFCMWFVYMPEEQFEDQDKRIQEFKSKYSNYDWEANSFGKSMRWTMRPEIALIKHEIETMLDIMKKEDLQVISGEDSEKYRSDWDDKWGS